MPVPQHPDILTRDFIAGDERFGWIQKADLLVLPSRYESLSLVTLEAWALGVPVLVNGDSPVLRGHCERSQGGLYYRTEQEFVASLRLLRSDAGLRRRLGREGQSYVRRNYDWNGITKQHISFLREIYDVVYPDSISARG